MFGTPQLPSMQHIPPDPAPEPKKPLPRIKNPTTKRSVNIERVALKVAATVRNGEIVNFGKIMRDVGYSKATSKHPEKIHRSKTFKTATKPVVQALNEEIKRVQAAMEDKDLALEEYKVLNYALDNLIRNAQLLSGGATERQVFVLPSEVIEKNQITSGNAVSEDTKLLPEAD